MPGPLSVTIDQTDEGRFRASYAEIGDETASPAAMNRSIEADGLTELLDRLKVLPAPAFEHAGDTEDDAADLSEAKAVMEDVRENGVVPWEEVEAEIGF